MRERITLDDHISSAQASLAGDMEEPALSGSSLGRGEHIKCKVGPVDTIILR